MTTCGFALESDPAGDGGGEIAITSVMHEFASQYRLGMMHLGWEGPSHVTGNITHCVQIPECERLVI